MTVSSSLLVNQSTSSHTSSGDESQKVLARCDSKFTQQIIDQNGMTLKFLDKKLQDCSDLVSKAVMQNGLALKYASTRLKQLESVVQLACAQNVKAFQYADPTLQESEDFIDSLIQTAGVEVLEYVPDYLKSHRLFMLRMVYASSEAIRFAQSSILDEDFLIDALSVNHLAFVYLDKRIQLNRDFIKRLMRDNYHVFPFLDNRLRLDRDFVFELISINPDVLQFIPYTLKDDKKFMTRLCSKEAAFFIFASDELKENAEFTEFLTSHINPKIADYFHLSLDV